MGKRIFYRVEDEHSAFDQVLLARRKGVGEISLYCPPSLARGPWVERFDSFDMAMELAALLTMQAEQRVALLTHDSDEWWLQGLTEIGNSDVLDRDYPERA